MSGVPMVGPILGGAFGLASGLQQQGAARREAERNRAFQRDMRATQYQTAVEDMRAAGLNPALAYMQGGAGNLSGSMGNIESVAPSVASGVSSAYAAANVSLVKAQRDLLQQQALKIQDERTGLGFQNEKLRNWLGIRSDGSIDPGSPFAAEMRRAGEETREITLSNVELEQIAKLWETVGSSGKGFQILIPLIIALLRRK